jgi:hypothetical protein
MRSLVSLALQQPYEAHCWRWGRLVKVQLPIELGRPPTWRVRLERYDAATDRIMKIDAEARRLLDTASNEIFFGLGAGPIARYRRLFDCVPQETAPRGKSTGIFSEPI